jgi:acetoin utilization deacetylase AcuC-like enzyme
MKTGYLWDSAYLGHFTSTVHPENPARAKALDPNLLRADIPGFHLIANDPDLGRPWVMRVHEPSYVTRVQNAFDDRVRALDAGDTVVRADTYSTALQSVGGALSLLRAVGSGVIDNGFAALRPPGHHAGRGNARGFCYFNNAAICARYAQQILGYERILIVDWDVHPADGTSAIFYDDPSVHVFSIHQDGIFSDSVGLREHRGSGAGVGATHNVPVDPGTGESDFLRAFMPALEKAALAARPDLVIISAGFDAHAGDPIGGLRLADASYATLTKAVRDIAKTTAKGRIVSLLEGGYQPQILYRCVRTHVASLME